MTSCLTHLDLRVGVHGEINPALKATILLNNCSVNVVVSFFNATKYMELVYHSKSLILNVFSSVI